MPGIAAERLLVRTLMKRVLPPANEVTVRTSLGPSPIIAKGKARPVGKGLANSEVRNTNMKVFQFVI